MTRKAKVGLLPLYIRLYDEIDSGIRKTFEPFLDGVAKALEREGLDVARAPICCVEKEFARAVAAFEKSGVDCIATLHLAYSPSGESAGVLARTALPVLMLDTTMDRSFGRKTPSARLMQNHGVHGVMDLAAVLRRRGKSFSIVAGHWRKSSVIRRAADVVRAALAAREFAGSRVLRIGRAFESMSDFAVAPAVLKRRFGIAVKEVRPTALAAAWKSVSAKDVAAELKADRGLYRVYASQDCLERSIRAGLAVRRVLDDGGFAAWSANFLDFNSKTGPASVVPFLEASKAMSRGLGYAGEGDVLTAALVGALIRGFGDATFTEIFCPDWKGRSLFLSHMGEINPSIAAAQPTLEERDYVFSAALNPAYLSCAVRPGPAVFVNMSPGPDDSFRLIAAPVELLRDSKRKDYRAVVRGWMRPEGTVAQFLESYSRLGGTHHSALVLGDRMDAVEAFAQMTGIEFRKV